MEKQRPFKRYIHSVMINQDFFSKHYYHSVIDLNLIKVDYMLQYGILSKALIEKRHLPQIYTHSADDYDSKNGQYFISLSEFPKDLNFSPYFESFTLHVLSSLSFLLSSDLEITRKGERSPYFDDEVFRYGRIPREAIQGILLPEHLTYQKIDQLAYLPSDLSCYTNRYIQNWIACTEAYFGKKIENQPIATSMKQLWSIIRQFERPENWVDSILEEQREKYGEDLRDVLARILNQLWANHLGLSNPRYIDVLESINRNRVPVYELRETGIQKIL